MATEATIFSCPACGIKLRAPVSPEVVVGPCPSCRTRIQAPASNNRAEPQAADRSDPLAEAQAPIADGVSALSAASCPGGGRNEPGRPAGRSACRCRLRWLVWLLLLIASGTVVKDWLSSRTNPPAKPSDKPFVVPQSLSQRPRSAPDVAETVTDGKEPVVPDGPMAAPEEKPEVVPEQPMLIEPAPPRPVSQG